MIILGIDPGTATTGWGVIKSVKRKSLNSKGNSKKTNGQYLELVDFGCILTDSGTEMGDRLLTLHKSLRKIIRSYDPEVVVIERLFFGANSTSAISVGQARGVVLLAAAEKKLNTYEYTGLQVKLTVADHGRADKKTIQTAVRRHLGIKNLPKPRDQHGNQIHRFRDDAYDAVAASICHLIKIADTR